MQYPQFPSHFLHFVAGVEYRSRLWRISLLPGLTVQGFLQNVKMWEVYPLFFVD